MFSYFEKFVDPFPQGPVEAPPTRSLVAFLWHFARPYKGPLIVLAILSAAFSIVEVSLYAILGVVVDWFASSTPQTFFADRGWELFGLAVLVLIVMPAINLFDGLINFQVIFASLPMRFRYTMHRWLLGHSIGFYQDEFAGRVSQKLMQTAISVRETVVKSIDVFLYVAVYFTGIVVLVAASDWKLVLPFAVWLLAYAGVLAFFIPRLSAVSEAQADARAEMTGRVVDAYSNIQTVKLFAHTRREADYARASMNIFLKPVYGQARLITGFIVSLQVINSLLLFAVAATGMVLWTNALVSAGAIAAAVGLVLRVHGMSQWIMWEVSALFENIGTIRDAMGTFRQPHAVTDRRGAPALAVKKGEVSFEKVSFHYGKGSGVLEGFDLKVRPGEKVGLIGRSGAGKSTILNLLLRVGDVEGGRIAIDGTDIASVSQESLRGAIGMVTQDTSLLHRSIRDNVMYGRPDATDEEVRAALSAAKADEFVHDLADREGRRGLDAEVGERGVKLSGGQRQRIAIARVMLKDAPILLLDEATSALDSEVEAAIAGNLYRLMEGKTVIAVAHRLSTIAALDRLIVLDRGRIVEEGTHDELVASGGLYAGLWARQTGGFLLSDENEDGDGGDEGSSVLRAAE